MLRRPSLQLDVGEREEGIDSNSRFSMSCEKKKGISKEVEET